MKKGLFIFFMLWVSLGCVAQKRVVMNRPYLDMRQLHYGFLLGLHVQDMEFQNNGRIDPETGEQWYSEIDNYSPGFNVGVLAELRLNTHFALRFTPTLLFGQKRAWFHEQISGRDTTQVIKSTIISFPLDVKFAAPRYNNFRPYFIAGANPSIDLTTRKHHALLMGAMDCSLEVGLGCDFYLPYFKLIPELKFSFGLANLLKKDRSDLIDSSLLKYTEALDRARSKMIVFTLYFE